MRKVLCLSVLLTSLSFAGISGVHADPVAQCNASKHKPISEIKVAWGTSYASAYNQLKRQYGSKARVVKKSDEEIEISFRSSQRQIFDLMSYKFTLGKLTFVGISYSDSFQRKMGGILDAWKLLAKKLIDRYSEKADDVTHEGGQVVASWTSQPVVTELFGKDPNVIFLKTACKPLKDDLEAKVRNSVNVGF